MPRPAAVVALLIGLGASLSACGDPTGGAAGDGGSAEDPAQEPAQEGTQETAGAAAETDGAGAAGDADAEQGGEAASGDVVGVADLADVAGNPLGTVTFTAVDGGLEVSAEVHDLDPGFHGLAVHEHGVCEPQSADDAGTVGDFFSAGGHLTSGAAESGEATTEAPSEGAGVTETPETPDTPETPEAQHPDHAGDLPNVLVDEDGDGRLAVVTDRLDAQLLTSGDDAAVILHRAADNHAQVPARYAPYGLDAETTTTGDAGLRSGCGVVEAP